MAREIIILAVQQSPVVLRVTGVFWLVPQANAIRPLPAFVSMVPLASAVAWGVTAAEQTALQNGAAVEQAFDSGEQEGGATLAQTETFLQNLYASAQSTLAAVNPVAKFVGGFWDGTTWTFPP